jgi:hypothetical protein
MWLCYNSMQLSDLCQFTRGPLGGIPIESVPRINGRSDGAQAPEPADR